MSFKQRLLRIAIRIASTVAPRRTAEWTAVKFTTPQRIPRPELEVELLKTGKKLALGKGLAAWSWGVGEKVLLVHGWDGRGSQLAAFVAPLVNAGFEVIALDGPAHGDSPGTQTDLFEFYNAILDSQRQLGPLHSVIAHSFGAVSTAVALARGLETRSVVLIASPCAPQNVFDAFAMGIGLSNKSRLLFQHTVETRAGITTAEGRVDRVPLARQVPALLVHDKNDKEIPFADVLAIAAAWPNAQSLHTEGLGHRRILKSESVVSSIVEFITAQRRTHAAAQQLQS